jgi:hypothetical protein
MTQIVKKHWATLLSTFALSLAITYAYTHADDANAQSSGGYTWVAFEVSCHATDPTYIDPGFPGYARSIACWPSRDTPNDSTDCFVIGDKNHNVTTTGMPVGGCAAAQYPSFAIDGDGLWCSAFDETTAVVIECIASR